ncbi:CYCD1-1 [Linum grandiflorum]
MSALSYVSDCLSDLLCAEESSEIFSGDSPAAECSSDIESSSCTEESIATFLVDEDRFVPGFDYLARFQTRSLDASAREEAVAWILKVQAYYNFSPLTAYLAVNYLDRFLYSRRLPKTEGWPLQLLSAACLSLAAKMEEPMVPTLLDLQVSSAKFVFEPRTVGRMELLVLSVLDWRLRSVTPFSFIGFFAWKLDSTGTYPGLLISRATDIILSNIQEASFVEYRPSSIAAAAVLCAANEIPSLSLANPEHAESWCDGLSKEKILSCYRLMQEMEVDNNNNNSNRRTATPMTIGRKRSITTTTATTTRTSESVSSSSSTSSSSIKRQKLNNFLWVDDDKGSS